MAKHELNSAHDALWVDSQYSTGTSAVELAKLTGESQILCQILARLGVKAPDVADYLDPKLRDLLPDPHILKDMTQASARIVDAIDAQEPVAIFADYDVDGASSAALLTEALRFYGLDPHLYIPDRVSEGYGPNIPAMEALAAEHSLIICVDCGTLAHEPIATARAKGAEVIVLDHHTGGETLPDAICVNPNRQDEENDYGYLCAAAVVFLTLVDVNRVLRPKRRTLFDLISALDLVALATVADVAPLLGLNRAFVKQGLKIIQEGRRPSLRALVNIANLQGPVTAETIGFALAPRLNASGRIANTHLATEFLLCRDDDELQRRAAELDAINQERRNLEAKASEEAIAIADTHPLSHIAYAVSDDWHVGVVGISASKLKSHSNKPSLVFSEVAGVVHGSARSVEGVDIGGAIVRLHHEGYILKGGGHKMAAGLTVERDKLEAAMTRLDVLVGKQGALASRTLSYDAEIQLRAANETLLTELDRAGPFGAAVPAPRFVFRNISVLKSFALKDIHLKLTLRDSYGGQLDAIAFQEVHGKIGAFLRAHAGEQFDFIGRLKLDYWRGRARVSFHVEDVKIAE